MTATTQAPVPTVQASPRYDWRSIVLVPSLAVVSAFLVGGLVILLSGESLSTVLAAYGALLRGSLGSPRALSETLTHATPLILAGLGLALGFRAGLFNIGAEGQLLVGGMAALAVGFSFSGLPFFLHLPLALAVGAAGGALWAAIAGWLKARTGAHEVITTIMLNNIAVFLVLFLLKTPFFQNPGRNDPVSKPVLPSASLPRLFAWYDDRMRLTAGIFVALAAAWFVYWLLFRSTYGFEFRAVGYNADAARYAGMRVPRATVVVMALAGALAGLAGGNQVLGVLGRATPGFSAGIGFDAIAMALLGRSHPWGVVAAGVLFGALRAGGQQMQVSAEVGIDIIGVIQALIIVFIAAPALIRAIYRIKLGRATGLVKEVVLTE
jgi:simple sugar transport system permease protein